MGCENSYPCENVFMRFRKLGVFVMHPAYACVFPWIQRPMDAFLEAYLCLP